MSENGPRNPNETINSQPVSGTTNNAPGTENAGGGPIFPSPVVFSPDWSPSTPEFGRAHRSRGRRMRTKLRRGRVVTATVLSVALGLSVGLMATQSA